MTAVLEPTVTRSSVDAPAMLRGLTAIAPFASTDATLPVLNQVRLEGNGERLTFVATNKFVLGSLSVPYTGEVFESGISLADIKALLPILKKLGRNGVDLYASTSNYGPEALVVKHFDGEVKLRPYHDFPQRWRSLIPERCTDGFLDRIALDPKQLAAFAKVPVSKEPMRLHFTSRLKPVRVEIGDDFLGVIMPTRIED